MRLLKYDNAGQFSLTDDLIRSIPKYAILSHTWGTEEFTFKDLIEGTGKDKLGYQKVRFCGEWARRDGLQYFWVDTCCIDKSSSAELSEAIISMFRWYQNAAKCYVYLSDVEDKSSQPAEEIAQSRWFTRGWTLQELLAPKSIIFFSKYGKELGNKRSLERLISERTGISIGALRGNPLSDFSVSERLLWAKNRETTRAEDKAYSLLGIFDVSMVVLYGEGREKAFSRLQEEIDKHSIGNRILERRGSSTIASPKRYTNVPRATGNRGIRTNSRNSDRYEEELETRCYRCDNNHYLRDCYARQDTVEKARGNRMSSGRCYNYATLVSSSSSRKATTTATSKKSSTSTSIINKYSQASKHANPRNWMLELSTTYNDEFVPYGAVLTQGMDTVPGKNYSIGFDLHFGGDGGQLRMSIDADTGNFVTFNKNFTGWKRVTAHFVANTLRSHFNIEFYTLQGAGLWDFDNSVVQPVI